MSQHAPPLPPVPSSRRYTDSSENVSDKGPNSPVLSTASTSRTVTPRNSVDGACLHAREFVLTVRSSGPSGPGSMSHSRSSSASYADPSTSPPPPVPLERKQLVKLIPRLDRADFDAAWVECNGADSAHMKTKRCHRLVTTLLDILFQKRKQFFVDIHHDLQSFLLTRSYSTLKANKGKRLKVLSQKLLKARVRLEDGQKKRYAGWLYS